ncbi:MAG: thiamine biosynthesis protein ThiS [Lentisphaerae bacterium RIFOXYB12_FULL_65_16]|nr:MAG: thiamine biosynthesis protein ThiS [Lentisphaerae bacterium RIFOXYA12_64_32]OGV88801.1 MAG: thiamine biosynthesis protein ThiS [Lentisphaerae bacterium RIFOXYB12_FULL_65_16]
MNITVNGVDKELPTEATIADLLRVMNADTARIAVLVNESVVPAESRPAHILHDGDRVEVLIFAGGG